MDIDPASVYTLRIKRIYLERILSGEKTVEYRDYKPYYAGLERPGIRYIRVHFQTRESALVEVTAIQVVPTPERLRASSIPFGPFVYAIHLGRVVEHVT